jgi:molybdopterin/thiamine biosynthesis adenylyltransferase
MKPWWIQSPERLEYELEALKAAGYSFEEPQKDEDSGVLSLDIKVNCLGKELKLSAEFPAFFPYVRCEVFAPELDLSHHQHPFSKNLCLLGRATTNWTVHDTLAGILKSQLENLLRAAEGKDRASVEGLELQQPEPFSYYYDYSGNSIVFVDSDWAVDPAVRKGRFQIDVASLTPFIGRVIQIEDDTGREIIKPKSIADGSRVLKGRWVRADGDVRQKSAEAILVEAAKLEPRLADARWQNIFQRQLDIIAILYPEETGWRTRGLGWLFVLKAERPEFVKRSWRSGRYDTYLLRPGRAGLIDIQSRAPELQSMQDKRVALIGLGALGGPTAIECARSGLGGLNIMDGDFVEPGNAVRWPLGFSAAGYSKADALANFIAQNYPYTKVKAFPLKLGSPTSLGGANLAQYEEFFSDANLIIDCTAEVGLHYALSQLARDRSIAYCSMSGTPGLWGGRVLRILPEKTEGCWNCFCHWLDEHKIPSPPEDPEGDSIMAGCAEPVFTGPNYNALQISSFGLRYALDAFNPEPRFAFDLCNVSFNSDSGAQLLPAWTTHNLSRHPTCTNH